MMSNQKKEWIVENGSGLAVITALLDGWLTRYQVTTEGENWLESKSALVVAWSTEMELDRPRRAKAQLSEANWLEDPG